uniref:Apoptosis and caspase activation inhibitor n=1 Tax=Myotis myotis TaxID=51298 RepID=A0A7J8AI76_MYOMY|nr:apoptosis and caspase activation inhibitor [Myotis myotis]
MGRWWPKKKKFLQKHPWRKKRLWNLSNQAHPKMLPRKSLKTGWTV